MTIYEYFTTHPILSDEDKVKYPFMTEAILTDVETALLFDYGQLKIFLENPEHIARRITAVFSMHRQALEFISSSLSFGDAMLQNHSETITTGDITAELVEIARITANTATASNTASDSARAYDGGGVVEVDKTTATSTGNASGNDDSTTNRDTTHDSTTTRHGLDGDAISQYDKILQFNMVYNFARYVSDLIISAIALPNYDTMPTEPNPYF